MSREGRSRERKGRKRGYLAKSANHCGLHGWQQNVDHLKAGHQEISNLADPRVDSVTWISYKYRNETIRYMLKVNELTTFVLKLNDSIGILRSFIDMYISTVSRNRADTIAISVIPTAIQSKSP